MISIIKQPYLCTLSRNPIDFVVQTDMYFDSQEVFPSVLFQRNSLPAIGTAYNLQWYNTETNKLQELQFVIKDGSDPEEYAGAFELPGTGYTGTAAQWIEILLDKLRNARIFNAFYTVEAVSSNQFKITAREAVEELKVQFSSNQVSSYVSIVQELNDFNIPEAREQYAMRALVYFEREYNSGMFDLVSTIDCVVDNDSTAHVDLSETLNAEIESSWDEYPVPWQQENKYIAPNLKRYFVEFVENWQDEPELITAVSEIMMVHWGGVNTDDHLRGDAIILNAAGGDFLTWFQSGKTIAKNQSDWLAWMNRDLEYIFDIHCVITTNEDVYDIVKHDITLKPFETVIFNTGFDANDLQGDVPSGEKIVKWTWYVGIDENKVSPEFTYYPDTNCIRKVLCFFNSYGIPETFNTSGEWQESVNISSEIASRAGSFNVNGLFPQNFIFDSKHGTSYSAVTGILDNETARRLKSMINAVISFVQEDGAWIPSIINNANTRILKLNDFQQQIELEILKANEDDRASFIGAVVDVVPVYGNGIEYLQLVTNGIQVQTYGTIDLIQGTLFSGGTVLDGFVWDAGQKIYYPNNPIQTEGEYRLEGTITAVDGTEYKIKKIIRYKLPEIVLSTFDTGNVDFGLRGTGPIAEITVDWGDGTIETPVYFNGSDTNILHNYSATGKKIIRLKKPSFADIRRFSTYKNLGRIEFALMPNLTHVLYSGGPGGNIYLSGLKKLQLIDIREQAMNMLSIGYQKDLQFVIMYDTNINAANLITLFRELWKYRKLYVNTPEVYITTPTYGVPPEVTAIQNGTGTYAGEGLVSDYSWVVMFV